MKKIYYLILLAFTIGCTPPKEARYTVAKMPESEIAYIKKITAVDSVFKAQKNEITKNEALEKGKKDMAEYILKNLSIENWVVKVDEIAVNTNPIDYIKVSVFVPIGNWREEKYPDLSFPVFTALLKIKPSKIKDQLKTLEKMDEVYISGHITKNSFGGINIIPSVIGFDSENTFSNLALDIDLSDIRKTH